MAEYAVEHGKSSDSKRATGSPKEIEMPKLRVVSGRELVKILTKRFFRVFGQKGNHVTLTDNVSPIIVPRHPEFTNSFRRLVNHLMHEIVSIMILPARCAVIS